MRRDTSRVRRVAAFESSDFVHLNGAHEKSPCYDSHHGWPRSPLAPSVQGDAGELESCAAQRYIIDTIPVGLTNMLL